MFNNGGRRGGGKGALCLFVEAACGNIIISGGSRGHYCIRGQLDGRRHLPTKKDDASAYGVYLEGGSPIDRENSDLLANYALVRACLAF